MQCRRQLCKSGSVAGSCAEARRPSGEVELTAACRWDARSSLHPATGWYVKAAAIPSLVSEEQWRQLRVRRLAWQEQGGSVPSTQAVVPSPGHSRDDSEKV